MPPSQQIKDFVKDLGKVFAVRFRRPKMNGPRSTSTDHAGDGSMHAQTPSTFSFPSPPVHSANSREPGLEPSTNVPFARYSRSVPLSREASDMAQLVLPLIQNVTSAIPLVGAPMQAAIGGLLTGLQAIDRRSQNQEDLNSLILRLDRLSRELCNASPSSDPVEQSRRDSLVRMLQDTSVRVTTLRERCLASMLVTQAIAGCFVEVDRYLAEYLWSCQMQSQREVHEILVILQREQENRQNFLMTIESMVARAHSSVGPTATQLIGTATRGCVTLIDATGHRHPLSVDFCTSFEQFNEMLKVLFKRNSIEARIQRQYMESGRYDLCIHEGMQVTRLTCDEWPRFEVGTKVVMRVIIQQQTRSSSGVSYRCSCGGVNPLGVGAITGSSIDCRKCGRRFQISRVSLPENQGSSTRSSNIDSDHGTDAGTDLIRNFHVQQTEYSSLDELFQCLWDCEELLHCNELVHGHDISLHLREYHGIRGPDHMPVICSWNNCNTEMNKESIVRHVQGTHLGIRFFCDTCSRLFTRRYGLEVHKNNCTGLQQ